MGKRLTKADLGLADAGSEEGTMRKTVNIDVTRPQYVTVTDVPFAQGEMLYDRLVAAGCDAALIAIEGAEHADIRFFQDEIWEEIISFFKGKL